MTLSSPYVVRRVFWLGACAVAILLDAPWRSGAGVLAVWLFVLALSFPAGLIFLLCYLHFGLRIPPVSWSPFELVMVIAVGYAQWFVLIPRLARVTTSNFRWSGP